jgi:hypothetical protein
MARFLLERSLFQSVYYYILPRAERSLLGHHLAVVAHPCRHRISLIAATRVRSRLRTL